jgi:hypothetical protein
MPVFSESEFQEFDAMIKKSADDVKRGKKPQISAVLMSLQFATTMPNEKGQMWFEDKVTALLVAMSVRKLMDENLPEMFSVSEKAYMFSILNTAKLLAAIDAAGMNIEGFFQDPNEEQPPEDQD